LEVSKGSRLDDVTLLMHPRRHVDSSEEEEEEEEDLFVFNDTIEGPRAPAVKP
jgi:hypothetical protein